MSRRLGLTLAMFVMGLALLVASALARPAGSASAAAEARKGGTLRLATVGDVTHIDPAVAYTPIVAPIVYATCAKLFNQPDARGAEGTKVIPEVVRSYSRSKDRRRYTFELRTTFRFHTGAPVTAQSFADAFNRDAHPRQNSPATNFMQEIVGARDVIEGKATSISGIRVLDRYRLQIRLTKPLGDLVTRLAMPFFCPILPNTLIDPVGIDNPAGSGPYYVAERIVNQRIVLKRNPYYRGTRPANVDQIVWTIGTSQEACLCAVEQDQIDHCVQFGVPATAYRALADKYGINRADGQLFVTPTLATWYLAFNHDRPAFRGPGQIPLKKAINYAIDRPELVRPWGYLAGKRTDQMLPPALARAESIYPLGGPNLVAARRWYAKARVRPSQLVLYTRSILRSHS